MRTARVLVTVLAMLLGASTNSSHAFEVATHAAITNSAWMRAMAESPTLLARLDLRGYRNESKALGIDYFDVFESTVRRRSTFQFEAIWIEDAPPKGLGLDEQVSTINGWLMSGAIREDDNPVESNPKDDPWQPGGAFHREFNHFYDPYYDRQLTVTGLSAIYGSQPIRKAPDWALGTANAFSDASTRDTQSTWNHFTLFDAREAMFRALTLKQRDSNGNYADVPGAQTAAQAETTRLAYWATTFRALGDVLHLNQDMAQPQHTRNEPHSGQTVLEYFGAGHTSAFEKYMDERARQVPQVFADGTSAPPPLLPFDGYPTPMFERFSDFWSTYPGPDSGTFGAGLADYSGNGFFTPAHNLGNAEYPRPPSTSYPGESVAGLLPARPHIAVKFLRGDVPDRYLGNPSNIRITTESLWDGRLGLGGIPVRTWNLNRFNYDDMASLLIPRAVAYSAGIIEHFFRGEMEINLPDAEIYGIVDHARFAPGQGAAPTDVYTGFRGFERIKLKLKNTTPRILARTGSYIDQPMPAGTLTAVLKFHRNVCYDDLLARWPMTGAEARACRSPVEEVVASETIVNQAVPFGTADNPNGVELTFHLANRELPINAWDVVLQVVYRGRLGAEGDVVVVATKNIAEPTFAGFMNTTDHVVINGRFYKPSEVAAQQSLFAAVLPACRSGQPGSYSVSPACHDRIDSFVFTAGQSQVAIVGMADNAVRPRRLARIALLTDRETRPRFSWQIEGVSCWVFLSNPLDLKPYPAEVDPEEAWIYGLPDNVRSVRVWELNVCYADIAVPATLPDRLDFTQLDDLAGQEIEPLPLTISGWN